MLRASSLLAVLALAACAHDTTILLSEFCGCQGTPSAVCEAGQCTFVAP